MKVIINVKHGGFGISEAAVMRYAEIKGITLYPEKDTKFKGFGIVHYWTVPAEERIKDVSPENWHSMSLEERRSYNAAYSAQQLEPREIGRDDPVLVQVVEELGDAANGSYASLKIVEVPDDVQWVIDEYDGLEWVAESHRTWR